MNLVSCEFEKEMLPITYKWLHDNEIKKLTNTIDFSEEDQLRWFKKIKNSKDYKIWVIYFDGVPIGVFGVKNIINNEGEYWGFIGEKKYWGKGIGKWMIDESIYYCKKMDLKKVYLKVLKSNIRAMNLYKKKGFIIVSSDCEMVKMEIQLT